MDTTSVADIKSELFDNPNIVPDTEKGEQPVRMHQQTIDSLTANANANSESNANEIVNEVIEEE